MSEYNGSNGDGKKAVSTTLTTAPFPASRKVYINGAQPGVQVPMLVEKDITNYSYCEHHFVPIFGKAHIAYFPNGHVIALSKLNRIAQYYAKRPQVQERLTIQIATELKDTLGTDDVAVIIDANHMCVASRGVNDVNSSTITSSFNGKFLNEATKSELLKYIYSK